MKPKPKAFSAGTDPMTKARMTPLSSASTVSTAPRVSIRKAVSLTRSRFSTAAREPASAPDRVVSFNATSDTLRPLASGERPPGRRLEGHGGRRHGLARLVHHLGEGELVLLGVGVLDIADRALGIGHVVGHALVALGADAGRPLHGSVGADLRLPVGADVRQVIGEVV